MSDQLFRSYWIGYGIAMVVLCFGVQQDQFLLLAGTYSIAFLAYFLLGFYPDYTDRDPLRFNLFFKLILVFAFPLASDDIYRFYWDGCTLMNGISPYHFKPSGWVAQAPVHVHHIYSLLNSKEYYSVYPPILQSVFAILAAVSFDSIYVFALLWKSILLLADWGTIRILQKGSNASDKKIFWYAWNPLVLYEVIANGHPEGLMIFFLICSYHALSHSQTNRSAVFLGLAAAVKLFPIVLSIYIAKYLGWKKGIRFTLLVTSVLVLSLLPIGYHYDHFLESIRLYFGRFEFNGSLFELWKAIDFKRFGFDNVSHIVPYLNIVLLIISGFLFYIQKRKDILSAYTSCFALWMGYLILNTTVHPWYMLPVLILGLITPHKWILVWSWSIILSYAWYDERIPIHWKYGFIAIEYFGLILAVWFASKGSRIIPSENTTL